MKKLLPDHLPAKTTREWRVRKRRQWRALERAFDAFCHGCAYTPLSDDAWKIQAALEVGREKLRGNWKP